MAHIFNEACAAVERLMPNYEPVMRATCLVQYLDGGAAQLPVKLSDYGDFLGSKFKLPRPVVGVFGGNEMLIIADTEEGQEGADKKRCFLLFQHSSHREYGDGAIEFVLGRMDETVCTPAILGSSDVMHVGCKPFIQKFAVVGPKGFVIQPIQAPNPQLGNKHLLAPVLKSVLNAMRLLAFVNASGGNYFERMPAGGFDPLAGKKIPRHPNRPVLVPRPFSMQ